MNRKQKTRIASIISLILIISAALGLILYALKQNINLFYTPTEVRQAILQPNQTLRIGGYVKEHSVQYDTTGTAVTFIVTDHQNDIAVTYRGILPNLFREGQGVVITGKFNSSHDLQADQVLAKHDEKYMPWSLEKALQKGKNRVT